MTTEPWQHRTLSTNGIRMHYVTQGSGPLLVLLHGFPEFWYSWRHQIPFLAEQGYTVVAPDLRGYNDTDKPRRGYGVGTLIRDIEGLIKGVGREKAIVVGHDWGGVVAWVFAARSPQMTERLIVLNAPHPQAFGRELRTLRQLRKSWYVFFFQLPWLPDYVLRRNHASAIGDLLRRAAVRKAAFPPQEVAKFQEAMSKPGAVTAALNYYRQAFRHPLGFRTRGGLHVSTPTLLIWGEQDIALGIELTLGLERWVDHLSIERLPDVGHFVQQEQPDSVNQLMLDFLHSSAERV